MGAAFAQDDKGVSGAILFAVRRVILSAAKNPEDIGAMRRAGILWILRRYAPQNDKVF